MPMTDPALRVPEVARLLEMDGTDVYELILQGDLAAGKGKDGQSTCGSQCSRTTSAATPQPRSSASNLSPQAAMRATHDGADHASAPWCLQ